MSESIEAPAIPILTPMIRGQNSLLGRGQQEIIATWAFKTALMAQFGHAPFRPVDQRHLDWLFTHRSVVSSAYVWIGGYVGHGGHFAWGRTMNYQLSQVLVPEHVVDAEVMTLCVGHLVLQTFKWSTPPESFALNIPEAVQRFILRIWPTSPLILRWPPEWSFDNLDSLSNYSNVFGLGPQSDQDGEAPEASGRA